MRIISFNLNGIRSAGQKGFFAWLAEQEADFVCLQELKAQHWQLTDPVFYPAGYHCHYHDAEKKGYSGVAVYSRREPDQVITGLGWPDIDAEGRYLHTRFGKLHVISLYMQSGSASEQRQAVKFAFMARFMPYLRGLQASGEDYVIAGDWNIAHRAIDLKNWKSNQKNSGFLPEERAWMDELFGPAGFVDAFRVVDPNPERYTWWSNRGRAREKNVGWRIDYQVVTPGLREKVKHAEIYTAQRFSDHAPLIVDYAYP
jgi:exodeoxyribonuclease-3